MSDDSHLEKLVKMYSLAAVNALYSPTLRVSPGEAEVRIPISERFFHSAGAVHGSVYFKMLDDAAFFAASTLEPEFFVLTTSFTTYITRPVSSGHMRSIGRVVNNTKTQFIVEAIAYDGEEREVARGSGVIVRSKIRLADVAHYST
ncbi:PaaI family thioesterase [Bradyrhizobium sp.]|jgi:uncharacterized protein (TIGR00369 family)|uniref:PaaI family thioesterase n=1 Tax=Bradyrhizobium sp. TaxID=376 RepID=UPI002DFA37CE|nr:PaaI family thioesterase [Bradyrhizobium sp.]